MAIEWVDEETLARREKAIKRVAELDGYLLNAKRRITGASSKSLKRWTREREQLCHEFKLTHQQIEDYKDYCQNLFRELISKGFAS